MDKASKMISLVCEVMGSALGAVKDLKGAEVVIFKDGTKHAGMMGSVINTHPDRNMVDVRLGKALFTDVDAADLLMVDQSKQFHASGEVAVPVATGPVATAAPDVKPDVTPEIPAPGASPATLTAQ